MQYQGAVTIKAATAQIDTCQERAVPTCSGLGSQEFLNLFLDFLGSFV